MDVECNKMREYLIENKMTSEIICENKSINTIQNLEFTNILLKNYSKTKTVVISSDYHIPRIKNLSKLNDCYLFSGSKTDKNIINEYVYQIVVNINLLNTDERKKYNSKTLVIPPWDPIGYVA